jgi:UDPglucose 6-dehydrogenase
MIQDYKISIIGLGFVGSAMQKSFLAKGFSINTNLFIYDKFKNGGIGSIDDILKSEIAFLALPTMFNEKTKEYDTSAIEETCKYLVNTNYRGAVVLKSTILPDTTKKLENDYKLNFVHNPEFLSARTAVEDFNNQDHIILGKGLMCEQFVFDKVVDFYKELFPKSEISTCLSSESESVKMFVNCFYAMKVQIMNEFYLVCKDLDINYDVVKDMMLKNGWISPNHTNVPGHDGKLSYGGMCFPKDTSALNEFMSKRNIPHKVLDATIQERDSMRHDKHNFIEK